MGKKREQFECRKNGCFAPPHRAGLCKDHHEEGAVQDNRREAAIEALHHCTINGIYLTSPDLRNELEKVRKWWCRACDAVNYRREDKILRGEAEFALEWCISLAQEVVDAEGSRREGKENHRPFSFQQTWLWERFENLEKGLMAVIRAQGER